MAILLLSIIYIAFIGLGLPDTLLGVSWPLMHVEFQAQEWMAGLLSLSVSVCTIVSSLFSGKVTKAFGTGKVTAISVFLTAVAITLVSIIPNVFLFFLIAIPLGLGAGAVDTSLNSYVARYFKPRHMSWLHALWGVGAMTGPVIMSFFLDDGNWRQGFFTVGIILMFLSSILLISLPIWQKFEKTKRFTMVKEQENPDSEYNLKKAIRYPGVKLSMLTFLAYCGIEMIIGLWGSTYLVNIKGIDVASASLWISFFFGGVMVARAISGCLTIKIKNEVQLRVGQGIIALGTILLLFPLPANTAAVAIVLIGLGCAPIFPLMLHETPKRFKDISSAVMGLQLAAAFSGSAFIPLGFGYLASATSFNIMPTILLAFIIIVIFCTEKINKLSKTNKR